MTGFLGLISPEGPRMELSATPALCHPHPWLGRTVGQQQGATRGSQSFLFSASFCPVPNEKHLIPFILVLKTFAENCQQTKQSPAHAGAMGCSQAQVLVPSNGRGLQIAGRRGRWEHGNQGGGLGSEPLSRGSSPLSLARAQGACPSHHSSRTH